MILTSYGIVVMRFRLIYSYSQQNWSI